MVTLANRTSIVVGIDGSENALNAARWAAAIATRLHAPLNLVTAIPHRPAYGLIQVPFVENELLDELGLVAKRRLADAVAAIRQDQSEVEISQTIGHGPAGQLLTDLSKHARLIVVGASRYNRVETVVLGSTALYVSHTAACPVVVWRGRKQQPMPDTRPILVGVDGSPTSEVALGEAFEFASILGVSLIAIHTWTGEDLSQWAAVPESWRPIEEEAQALLSECLAGWRDKFPDVEVASHLLRTQPAQTLLDRARDAQLVVVGSHGYNRIAGVLLGSTSQNLIHHAPSPVLVCHEKPK